MYKLFLTLRYLLHRRIVIVPILAVMLCVAMDLIVTSLMGGFLDKIRTSVRGLFGDVIVGNGSLAGFGYYDTYQGADGREHPGLLQYIRKAPEVKQATAVIETYAVLRLPNRGGFTCPVRVLGIEPDEYAAVTDFQDGLYWQREFGPEVTNAEKAQETSSEEPPNSDWHGPPAFDKVPHPRTGQAIPLPSLYPKIEKDQVTGVIVGVRVFWPSPEKDGRYFRERLTSGLVPVQLTLLPMSAKGGTGEAPRMKEYFLVDTAYSHIPQIDQAVAYLPFKSIQETMEMNPSTGGGLPTPGRATRVLVKLKDGVDLPAGRKAVDRAVSAWLGDRRRQFAQFTPDQQRDRIFLEPFRWSVAFENPIPPSQPDDDPVEKPAELQPGLAGIAAEVPVDPTVKVEVWEEANKDYFSAIANQRFIALLMVGIVSLTVVALIWVIFIMIVVEKTKDIGIIKSVGGSAGGVACIFIAWSAVIGAIGSALGGLLGWLFIRYINPIERWLSAVLSSITKKEINLFDPRAYLFDSIPARFKWDEMLWIAASAIAAAMLGALLPAWRAGRMDPVESLRYE